MQSRKKEFKARVIFTRPQALAEKSALKLMKFIDDRDVDVVAVPCEEVIFTETDFLKQKKNNFKNDAVIVTSGHAFTALVRLFNKFDVAFHTIFSVSDVPSRVRKHFLFVEKPSCKKNLAESIFFKAGKWLEAHPNSVAYYLRGKNISFKPNHERIRQKIIYNIRALDSCDKIKANLLVKTVFPVYSANQAKNLATILLKTDSNHLFIALSQRIADKIKTNFKSNTKLNIIVADEPSEESLFVALKDAIC